MAWTMIRELENPGQCDICDKGNSARYAAIARGATGRYCEVIWFCKECAGVTAEHPAITREEAYKRIEELGNGYADF